MCTVLLLPDVNTTAVNKSVSYHVYISSPIWTKFSIRIPHTVPFNILNVVKLDLWMDVLSYGDTLNRIHVCTVKLYVLKIRNSMTSGTYCVTVYNICNIVRFLALICLKLHRSQSRLAHIVRTGLRRSSTDLDASGRRSETLGKF
jgi:hypothetical protein